MARGNQGFIEITKKMMLDSVITFKRRSGEIAHSHRFLVKPDGDNWGRLSEFVVVNDKPIGAEGQELNLKLKLFGSSFDRPGYYKDGPDKGKAYVYREGVTRFEFVELVN